MMSSLLPAPTPRTEPADAFSAQAAAEVHRLARQLRLAASLGHARKPLRERRLALLRTERQFGDGRPLLQRAARDLGARVVCLDVSDAQLDSPARVSRMSKLLGRVCDAADCGAVKPAVASRIQHEAGVPVFCGLDRPDHWVRVLADLLSLEDHGLRRGPAASLHFHGQAGTWADLAWRQVASALGYRLQDGTQVRSAGAARTFAVDATGTAQWLLQTPGGMVRYIERAWNHHFAIQAMLVHGLSAG